MRDNGEELFPEVDESGRVLRSMTRAEAHDGSKRLHPVVHLHLFNSDGDVYLQHRPAWKVIQPDRWDTACGGHIDFGETVEDALRREVLEELGIDLTQTPEPEYLGMYIWESERDREMVYAYRLVWDGPVLPSAEELDGGRFWRRDEIAAARGRGLLTPNFETEFDRLFGKA